MKKCLFVAAIAAAGLLSSCATSMHLTTNHNVTQTNVDLSQKNYRVIGTVEGSATISRVLGIGGVSKKAIKDNAYANMVKNAKLSGSQAIVNTTTEVKNRGVVPFYVKTVVTTTGQVVEFTE